MKDVRFYEELRHKNRKGEESRGTVVAVWPESGRLSRNGDGSYQYLYDGVVGVFDHADSPVASCSVARRYLQEECRRIGEARAREIHPQLFKYLDE